MVGDAAGDDGAAVAGDGAAGGADLERRTVVDKTLALVLALEVEHDESGDGDEEHSETVVVDAVDGVAGDDADGEVAVGVGGGAGAGDGAQSHTELAQKANETATKRKPESWLSWPSRDWNRRS